MGFFSWITQDTERNIFNVYTERHFTVHMIDDTGRVWTETEYDGYGVFGGKDYYELLAEMNMIDPKQHTRDVGIDLEFEPHNVKGERKHEVIRYPSLVEYKRSGYQNGRQPEGCPYQGYFYDDEDDCNDWDCDDDYEDDEW